MKTREITYQEAKKMMENSCFEYEFSLINESTVAKGTPFEMVQNRRYYVRQIKRKGAILYKNSEYETIADKGIFLVIMTFDYRHPRNFALNQNNVEREFRVAL